MILSDDNLKEFIKKARDHATLETCALILETHSTHELFFCENVSNEKDSFIINPLEYLKAQAIGKVVGVVHSHVDGPDEFSQSDIHSSERTGLPFYLYNIESKNLIEYIPMKFRGPLIGRDWVHGINDCFTLIKDYYKQHLFIDLKDMYRAPYWWEQTSNLYMLNFSDYGFRVVKTPQVNDIALCKVGSPVPNHGAIVLDNNYILHHFYKHLSCTEVFGMLWRKSAKLFLRHESLCDK